MMRNYLLTIAALVVICSTASAEILLENVSKDRAKELGIVMKSKPNGNGGLMVWLEFKEKGAFGKFSYAEVRIGASDTKDQLSAMLKVAPVDKGQPDDVLSVAFSAARPLLENCSFWVVAYEEPMSGVGYILSVSEFIDLKIE